MAMLVIGLTGGIGSGKSFVADIIKRHYPVAVIDTDSLARDLMKKGGSAYNRVKEYFGSGILAEDGEIDRERLSGIVFSDPDSLSKLNSLTHPAVQEKVLALIRGYRESGNYLAVLVETALLIEAGYQSFCDEVFYVHADEKIRRMRLKESRGYTDKKIDRILANQKPEEEFIRHATWLIENNSGEEEVLRQLEVIMSAKGIG